MSASGGTRRGFMRSVGAAALLAAAARPGSLQAEEGDRPMAPNVILVMTDDQGYGDLACHGNDTIRTPNIDRFHGHSVRLTDFHVAPTCSPTRAGLMTGRNCNRTGVWHTIMGRSILRDDEITMADVFAAGGYRTGIFGKWHLGDNYPSRPQDRGFQETLIHGGGGVGQTPDYWGNDYTDDVYWHNGVPEQQTGYCTDVFFDAAMEFIEASDGPFFAYIPTNAAHGPYNVADEWLQPYRGAALAEQLARFYGICENIDWNMGRLMDRLAELGLADNTILIFMTDNGTGDQGFNAGMRGRKGSQYEGGHRVPCFIRWPDGGLVAPGTDIDTLTTHLDLLPTLAEFCGTPGPEAQLDGTSLAQLLRGERQLADRTIVVDSQRIEHPEKWRASAVMAGGWRLIDGKELYDIKADPGQERDIATENPQIAEELRAEYEAWWDDVSARFDEYCAITLGSDAENPARLTCMDWHEVFSPWRQGLIREGTEANGFFAVEVAEPGAYEITLRRWPEEADTPITAPIDGAGAISATTARLAIHEIDESLPIPQGAKAVTFTVELPATQTTLKIWFQNDAGEDRGAYYVYVERLH